VIIKVWPPYPEEFSDLDYSLRDGGWLDVYQAGAGTERFTAIENKMIVGFSLLLKETDNRAEFRIALHPDKLGHGIGRSVVLLTLAHGFADPGTLVIRLIVRKNNSRAKRLYESLSFRTTGECTDVVQGKTMAFYSMEIDRNTFTRVNMK